MISVAIGIHDPQGEYACHAGAMLASLFARATQPVCAHLLHNATLTADNRDRLSSIARHFRQELRFYSVALPEAVRPLGGHVTEGALFRLLLPDLLQADKVIYFDCDIVVGLDIDELWRLDMQEKPVAAALDPGFPSFPDHILRRIRATGIQTTNYFNSGVLVMDLKHLREKYRLFHQAVDFLLRFPDSVFHDQDALNRLFEENFRVLDPRFNRIVSRTPSNAWNQQAIWHFAGVKPWKVYSSAQDMLYWKALLQTPWRDEVLDRLAGAMASTIRQMNAMLNR